MANRTCSVARCRRRVSGRDLCASHLRRKELYGCPTSPVERAVPGELVGYLLGTAVPHKGDDCLMWPYGTDSAGYGKLCLGGKTVRAHRFVCEAIHGPAPTARHHAAHSCGNGDKGCLSPRHLSWKTPKQNQADRLVHGTDNRGEKNGNALLTAEKVREIRSLRRKISNTVLAELFGVSRTTISHVHTRKVWASV
jgi:hypothetical protein